MLVILGSWFAQNFLEDTLISRLRCTGPEIRKGSVFLFWWDKSEVRIWRSGGEHLLVFGCRRAFSAASAPARLGPGPCRQVSDCSSHEINSAWNLECSVATSSVFVRRKHPFDPIVTDQILAIISLDSLIRPQPPPLSFPPARRYCYHCLSPCLDRQSAVRVFSPPLCRKYTEVQRPICREIYIYAFV